MKFSDYKYERPDFTKVKDDLTALIEKFKNSSSSEEQIKAFDEINKIRNYINTMATLVSIRNSINTTDEFYEKEKEFFDETLPTYQGVINEVYKALNESKFKNDLENKYGKYLFDKIEVELKTFKPEIIEDLINENKLSTKYDKLMASAKIEFEGGIRNLSQMTPFMESPDRKIREAAQLKVAEFLAQHESEIDEIYDELVKVRTQMAHKLGYENYIDLGYARLGRTDYNSEMVANYRKQVYEDLVPIAQKLIKRQKERLGIEDFKYYDLNLKFLSGNAKPIGDKDYLVAQAQKMYSEMSPQTKEFFEYMVERELLDLEAKEGKRGGGYCTFISDYESPFIFSNFNGTSGDVDVLTHEAGHAFQTYMSRGFDIPEYLFPTLEACEIHSMSMEFFAWPWMELFFGDSKDKYLFTHLSEAVLFVPYGVAVDEFQHYVYENYNATPDERKAKWREIEKKYLPHKTYEGNEMMEKGCYWFRQSHIFSVPFYYIDYTLAQICAFQYFIRSRKNRDEAWNSYLHLCSLGGSKPFLELVKEAGLNNPFNDGTIANVMVEIEEVLNGFNDKNMD
ncbi:MAG TPA: M3 family oligoendopeptidase [Acholeplasmataceae bacterium]|nr:M3 family oligoendopeptidase [Acholeplasmataceae bacterium]